MLLRALSLCGLLLPVEIVWCAPQSPPPEFRYRYSALPPVLPPIALDPAVEGDLSSGDIDGNGLVDVAWLQQGSSRISYSLASGDGRFSGAFAVPSTGAYARCALLDLDADGFDDLLAAGAPRAWVLRSLGSAGFAAPVELMGSDWTGHGGAFGGADVDGDADVDVVVGTRLYRQQSPWAFVEDPGARLPANLGPTALADLDADGDPDLATAVSAHFNDGTGHWSTLGSPTFLPAAPRTGARPPVVAAFQGGPIPELLFIDDHGEVRYFESAGGGTWIDRTSLSTWPPRDLSEMHAKDFDGDGRLDVLLVRNPTYVLQHESLVLMRNAGGGVFLDESATLLPHAEIRGGEAVLGDWNGDGASEVLLIGFFWISRLYWNDGRGRLVLLHGPMLPAGLPQAYRSCTCDLDGDGAQEIVLASGYLRLLRNDAWGRFEDLGSAPFPSPPANCFGAACADLDGDGREDVIAVCHGQSRFYRNLGGFRFADETATRLPAFLATTDDIRVLDVDRDGDRDLYLLNTGVYPYTGLIDRLLINQGQGIFAFGGTSSLPTLPISSTAVQEGDFDRDGDPDLFLVSLDRERLLTNDGHGNFTIAPLVHLPSLVVPALDVDAGDLDADGDLDLYTLRPLTWTSGGPLGGSEVYLNDGAGRFALLPRAVPLGFSAPGASTVQLYDLDGDGRLDAIEARGEFSRLLRNTGNGSFVRILEGGAALSRDRIPVPSWQNCGMRAGDWDRDQDADLLVLYWNGNGWSSSPLVLQGTQRQLVVASPPFIGRKVELGVVHEAPVATIGAGWIPFVSAGRSAIGIPVPPFGTFGLDLVGLNALPLRPLLQGSSVAAFGLPADPTLAQQWLHFQVLFLPSAASSSWKLSSVVSAVALP